MASRQSRVRRFYRLLLRLLPSDFRAEFGHEMEGVFLDEHRAAETARRGAASRLWLRTLFGMLAIAPAQHLDVLKQDVTYATRSLARAPVFAGTALLALALGIGGMCAVLTLVHQVVLRQLPVPEPDRLVYFDSPSFSYPVVKEVQQRVPTLEGVFGWSIDRRLVTFDAGAESVDVMDATTGIHETLGITPAAGRLLQPADDERREAVAVLSYDTWQQRFGGAGDVIGKRVMVEHTPVAIVGVTPQAFFGVAPGLAPELTIPATLAARLRAEDADILESLGASWLHIMGRVGRGLTVAEADAALQAAWPGILESVTPAATPQKDRERYLRRKTKLVEADTGFSRVRRQYAEPLWLLTALVGLLLTIGCGTIANMMLSRTLARGHELALRRAIGAGRGRLLRQLLTESLMLTAAGAALGVLLGIAGSRALVRLLSTTDVAIAVDTMPTSWTLAAAGGLALVMAVVITAFSMLCALRAQAGDALRAAPRAAGASTGERRLSGVLVSVQVALSLTLVVGAGVFALNLTRLVSQPIGLDRSRLIVASPDAVFAGHTGAKLPLYYARALDRLADVPGVVSVSYSRKAPISSRDGSWWEDVGVNDRPADALGRRTYLNAVSEDYFATTGTRLLAGRTFERRDGPGALPVVIINARLGHRLFGTESPIGQRIHIERDRQRQHFEIIGVVENAAYQFVQEDRRQIAYFPYRQAAGMLENRNLVFELRTTGPAGASIHAVREALRQVDAAVPVTIETLEARIAESLVQERALALLASALGMTALVLAAAALYGLTSYSATARTREFGVRVALGATPAAIVRLVVRDAVVITAVGLALGFALTQMLGRFTRSLLVASTPGDPAALGAAVGVVCAVALAAASVPAWRSTRVQPTEALRTE
jgi:predicted permease